MKPLNGRTRARFRNRVLGRAPAGIDGVPDPEIGQPVRQRNEYFSREGFRGGFGFQIRVIFGEAKGSEFLGDSLDGGLGQNLSGSGLGPGVGVGAMYLEFEGFRL